MVIGVARIPRIYLFKKNVFFPECSGRIPTEFKFQRSFLLLCSAAAERQSPSLGMPSPTSRRCIPNKRGGERAARRWTELHNRIELNIRIMDAMRRLDTLAYAYVPIAAPPIMALTKNPPKRRYNLPMHPARSPSSSDIKLGEKRSSRTQMR